jgi:hypothetical protein
VQRKASAGLIIRTSIGKPAMQFERSFDGSHSRPENDDSENDVVAAAQICANTVGECDAGSTRASTSKITAATLL